MNTDRQLNYSATPLTASALAWQETNFDIRNYQSPRTFWKGFSTQSQKIALRAKVFPVT